MKNKPNQNQITWGITIFFVAVGTLLAYYIIFHGRTFLSTLNNMLDSISGVIMGVVLAYILIPMLNGIERTILIPIYKRRGIDVSFSKDADWKKRKQMRGIAVLITIAIFILLVYTLLIIIIPQLVSSIREIINNLPDYIKKVDDYSNSLLDNNPDLQELIDSQLDSYYATLSVFITRNIKPYLPEWQTVLKVASKSVMSGVSAIINIIVGVIVAIYVLNSKERFTTRGKKIAYSLFKENVANELISAFRFTHRTFESFIGGKIVDSIIIGIICYIGCKILKIDYPVLISVIVGVTNVIPFFGPYIGGGAGALLLILIDPIQALIFLIFVIVLQQFDGNILGPYILGGSTGLSSFWVIFSIMFFGGLWGIVGWLIGVPIFAVFYAFVARITNHYLRKKSLSTDTSDYYDLAYIENGEYKPLSDQANTKYNAGRKKVSGLKKLFDRKKTTKK
ncbi:AI-2E family transporter [Butyrivibrio sp. FCS006]|uniref:AI-2E family transporter n=1 Tax=Butyrivibrio sp. FCS006 TaxID=1280684 RepID=UPI00040C0F81|nr:AI-2E family transporter [Butyrivibrio sp. FCS006]